MYTKEADVKAEVKKLLTQHGWFWFMPPANGYGRTGISDILALRHGTFLAIETKFGGNTVTTMQEKFLAQVEAAGGIRMVLDETSVGEFAQWLHGHAVP
jgi:Holliday junction resolvase